MHSFLHENSLTKKNIAFGFQISAGLREESGRVIAIHGGGKMIIGNIDDEQTFKPILDQAFKQSKYRLIFNEDMDTWLKSHIVPIIAMNSLHYLYDFDLKTLSKSKESLIEMINVMNEGFLLLENIGYTIDPTIQMKMVRNYRYMTYYGLKFYHKLPLTKIVDGSFEEILALYEAFDILKEQANISTPHWDSLQKQVTNKYLEEYHNDSF
jgi:2-dehydropantoate 2-reductase